mmetsp:Transcript_29888/g.68903  ORF Transcript_29888/g.68903 Transcript_29888/m.68903 type:complete len:335 (+) Transcript_29888:70-1074(+)
MEQEGNRRAETESHGLATTCEGLTAAAIASAANPGSFQKAMELVKKRAVNVVRCHGPHAVEVTVQSERGPDAYSVLVVPHSISASCTCYDHTRRGGLCKHGAAAMLALMPGHRESTGSFDSADSEDVAEEPGPQHTGGNAQAPKSIWPAAASDASCGRATSSPVQIPLVPTPLRQRDAIKRTPDKVGGMFRFMVPAKHRRIDSEAMRADIAETDSPGTAVDSISDDDRGDCPDKALDVKVTLQAVPNPRSAVALSQMPQKRNALKEKVALRQLGKAIAAGHADAFNTELGRLNGVVLSDIANLVQQAVVGTQEAGAMHILQALLARPEVIACAA